MTKPTSKTVFICEDDPGIVEVVTIILQSEGYTVQAYTSGRNLEEAVIREQPALLLLDLWMPEMNGPTLVKDLRANPATKNIPVVLVSAATDLEQIAKESGVPFLRKPFHIDELLAAVKETLV